MKRRKLSLVGRFSMAMVLLMSVIWVTGCGKADGAHMGGADSGQDNPFETSYQGEDKQAETRNEAELRQWNVVHSPLSVQYELATTDEEYIYGCRYLEGGAGIDVYGKGTSQKEGHYEIPGATEIKSISVNRDKEICVFGSMGTGNTGVGSAGSGVAGNTDGSEGSGNILWTIDSTGTLHTIEGIEVEDLGLFPVLKNFYTDSNGFYYLWYQMSVPCAEVYEGGEEDVYTALDRIYVKDGQMNTIVYEQIPDSNNNKLVSLSFNEAGIPLMLARDEEGYYVKQVRTSDQEEYKSQRLKLDSVTDQLYHLDNGGMIAFVQEGLLYTSEGSLHRYDMSNAQDQKLLNLAATGIFEEDIIYLGMRDGLIEIIDNYKGLGQSEYTTIQEGESQRTQITMGLMSLEGGMKEEVAFFNRYQNEVTIVPVTYVENYDYEAGYERLALDLVQGKAPDVICTDGLDADILAGAGAFSDLYGFMQKDSELTKEDLVPSVVKVYEADGHLYTLAPTFRIYSMWGAGSVVDGRKGVDVEEMIQMLQENGGDINSIYGFSADESVLTTLCSFNMDKFINWSEGTCDFTGEEFQQVVRFAKEYKGTPIDSLYQAIQNQDILLTLSIINSVEDYRLQSELYGEKVEFVGYPTGAGSGSAVLLGGEVAVNSQSAHQKEAWEFVKYYVQNGYSGSGFPLMKAQFDKVLEEALMPEMSLAEDGRQEKVAKISYREQGVVNIIVHECDSEDVEAVRDVVNNVSDKAQYHIEIQQIIEEESTAYFKEQKSLDEVCAIIQSRVQLYLNERR